MQHEIKKYPVQHPLLKNYIRFFWELHVDNVQLNHKIIPQRNINMRFNLNDTPQYVIHPDREQLLEDVFFSGLQDHFGSYHLKMTGKADILGICFFPEGLYPFLKIPVHEFKNQLVNAGEIGFQYAATISEQLKEAPNVTSRLAILENELLRLLHESSVPDNFRQLFHALKQDETPLQIAEFCRHHQINERWLERMYNKYIGVSPNTYNTLNRFHHTLNQMFVQKYDKLSDLAFDNGYFDQMHFIKDFKRFSGDTPKNFVRQNNSILQIGSFA